MITILKLAGLSAVLSAGLVSGFTAPEQKLAAEQAKLFYDRAPDGTVPAPVRLAALDARVQVRPDVNGEAKGHRARLRQDVGCTDGAWLLVPADCVPNFDASSVKVSEIRSSGTVSVVMRDGGPTAIAFR